MNNSNSEKDEKSPSKKLLKKKRNPTYSLEDIINIYCCRHKIQDNEIMGKIKTIHYEKPSEFIEINYDKDKGDKFPLSNHIKPAHLKKEIELEEAREEKKEEKAQSQDDISSCFLCGWEFLKGMSIQEKNTHINLCAEGNGEQNKKELISTYTEIENLQKLNEPIENNNNNKDENRIKDKNEELEKNDESKNDEDDSEDEKEEEVNSNKNNKKRIVYDNNDDDLML
jgi:hypothetical protein